jgi:broad specificity phosphatase PhoE
MGRDQARAARLIVEQLDVKPTLIIHSQLSRARETAAIINENLKLEMHEDSDLAEMHAGDWEGVPYDQCAAMLDDWLDPPGGETYDEFFARIRRAKARALEKKPSPVLVVCHGGVMRALWKMYGISMPGVRNCHLHEFSPAPEQQDFPWKTFAHDYDHAIHKRPLRQQVIYKGDETIDW